MRLKILLFWLGMLSMAAQNNGSVSGKVVDQATKEPLSYVNVVFKQDGKTITGGITDDKGMFTIKGLPLQKLIVEVQFIGYKTFTSEVVLSTDKKMVALGTVAITEEATQLEGVEVVKEKSIMEQKVDRKVINVGKDLISAGATAGELMNNIPSVSVDAQTNEISLRGNSNVRILIDGKPTTMSPAQVLKQIPSASIKQVELITNPSAKYNPEGMSGMINIILHKNANMGFNGSVNTGVTFGKTPKVNTSLDMNYKVGKVNFFGNYGYNTGIYHNEGFMNSYQTDYENYQVFKFTNENTSNFFKAGMDYYINDNNTVSFFTNQSWYRGVGDGFSSVDFTDPLKTDRLQNTYTRSVSDAPSYNLDYKHKFAKEGENIELEMNYAKNKSPEYTTFTYPLEDQITLNDVGDTFDNFIANLDYENPLSDKSKLELGLETRIDETNNNFYVDKAYDSDFNYNRKIFSAYATYGKSWDKWSVQGGLRAENYTVSALFKKDGSDNATFNDDIFTFYPTLFVTHTLSEKHSFQFSYSRRVDRPSIGQVNPIREWSTQTVQSQGNPNLKPQFTNSIEVNYTSKVKIGSITAGVFYRYINDEITRVILEHPTDAEKRIMTYENFKDNNSYGAELSANLNFTKWWSANISADAYYRTIRGVVAQESLEADALMFNTRINNNFTVNKKLRLQWFGMYRGKDLSLQFVRKPMYRTDIGASYNVFKGNGTLSARVSDIFKNMKFAFEGDKPYPQTGQFTWETRTLYVGFNYRFGGGKNRAIQRKQRDRNETQGSGGML